MSLCIKPDYAAVKSKIDGEVAPRFIFRFNQSKGIFSYEQSYKLLFMRSRSSCSGGMSSKTYTSPTQSYTAYAQTYNGYRYRAEFKVKRAKAIVNGEEVIGTTINKCSTETIMRQSPNNSSTCFDKQVKVPQNVTNTKKGGAGLQSPAGLFYIAYDEVGNAVGYSKSRSYGFNDKVEMICKYVGELKHRSKFIIHCYLNGMETTMSFPCEYKDGNFIRNEFTAPNVSSTSGGLKETFDYIERYNFITENYEDDGVLLNQFNSVQPSFFGEKGKCPYRYFFKGFCKPIPYSIVEPALLQAQQYSRDNNEIGWSNPETNNVDFNLPLTSLISLKNLYNDDSSILHFQSDVDRGKDIFLYAVDKNGIVRLSSGKGMNWFATINESWRGHATLPAFLYGIQTTGLKEGDPLDIYMSDERLDFLYRINSGEGDGTFPFKLGKADYNNTYPEIVRQGSEKCPTDISTRIWGWIGEVGDELSNVDDLRADVDEYEEKETQWTSEREGFESTIERLNQEKLSLQNNASEVESDVEQRYDDFFNSLSQSLASSITSLNSALGSSDSEDPVDGGVSNFDGKDPFKYKKNKY